MMAALTARTRSSIRMAKLSHVAHGSKVGIISLRRLQHAQSEASHRAVSASLIAVPQLRLRPGGLSTSPAQRSRVPERAQRMLIVAHSA